MAGTVVVMVALTAFTVLLVSSIAMADMAAHMYVFAFIYYLVFAIISPNHYQKKITPNLIWNIERRYYSCRSSSCYFK